MEEEDDEEEVQCMQRCRVGSRIEMRLEGKFNAALQNSEALGHGAESPGLLNAQMHNNVQNDFLPVCVRRENIRIIVDCRCLLELYMN